MNGLSKKIIVSVTLYVLLFFFLVGSVFLYPKIYNYFEDQRIKEIKQEIKLILKEKKSIDSALEKLSEKNNFEMQVYQDYQLLYQSIPTTRINLKEEDKNNKNLAYQGTYKEDIGDMHYLIWLAVYPEDIQKRFDKLVIFVGVILFITFTILTLILFFIYKALLNPMIKLKESVLHLKRLDFEKAILLTSVSDKGILSDLSSFSVNLKSNIDNLGSRFTELELELQKEHELGKYKEKLINSLIHDLKTPLTILIMMTEVQLEKTSSSEQSFFLEELLQRYQTVMDEVNNVLQVVSKKIEIMEEAEIDLVVVLREAMSRFKSLVRNKRLHSDFLLPEALVVGMSRIEANQLFHNAISNLINYSPADGYFSIQFVEEKDRIVLIFYNEVQNLEEIDFEHAFDLFYQGNQQESQHSSGLGLYTIRAIISQHQGEYHFYPKEQGVVLEMIIFSKRASG